MRRRQLLQTLGAGVATLGLVSQASAREAGELPDDDVDTTLVSAWPPGKTYHVPAGDWIEHSWGWIDSEGGGSTKEDVQRWLDAVEHTMRIDGKRIENPAQYWSDVYYSAEFGGWMTAWKYYTPPKTPGKHTFTVVQAYPDGFQDGGFDIEPGARYRHQNDYIVEPPRGSK